MYKKIVIPVILLLLVLQTNYLLFASENTEAKSEASAEAVVESENDVIATVNGEKIIRKDFDRRLNVFKRLNQEVTRSNKMLILDQLTKKILLLTLMAILGVILVRLG